MSGEEHEGMPKPPGFTGEQMIATVHGEPGYLSRHGGLGSGPFAQVAVSARVRRPHAVTTVSRYDFTVAELLSALDIAPGSAEMTVSRDGDQLSVIVTRTEKLR